MTSRFSVFFGALAASIVAGAAHAERPLTRTEIIVFSKTNAVCYGDLQNGCYAAEFFTNPTPDTIDITYVYWADPGYIAVTETATWDGDWICVPGDSSGITQAWFLPTSGLNFDYEFPFDLSGTEPMTTLEMAGLRQSYDGRAEVWCYTFHASDDSKTNLRSVFDEQGYAGGTDLVFVPLSAGRLALE